MWALALEDTLIIERHGASLFDHTGADSSARLCYAYGGWSRSGGGAEGVGGSLLSPSNQTPPANPRGSLQSPHAPPLLHHLHTDTRGIFLDFIIRPELRLMEPPAGRSTSLGCGVCAANNNMAVSRGSLVVFVWTSLSDAGVTGLASDD